VTALDQAPARSTDRAELVARLRSLEPEFRAHGITGLAIFGSRARADSAVRSDLDLLIDVDAEAAFSLFDLVGVSHLVHDRLGLPADILMRRSLDPALTREIASDIVEVF
jgi:predicted nucleotidyltransferase